MARCFRISLLPIVVLLMALCSRALCDANNRIKSAVFYSPRFELGPGSVEDKFYYNIDFPRGHIALKSFDAEVIDEDGNSVPLHETYLHHWVIARYYGRRGAEPVFRDNGHHMSDVIFVRNSGICQGGVLGQYFGLGSETRKTSTWVPDPYGIEIGDPAKVPTGYEERWLLNVHAIDTRGVEDRLGCTECRCDLYNITLDAYGRPLRPDYKGGLLCCYDQTQCRVRQGFQGARRGLHLRYNVSWVDMDSSVLPVKIYIFDVTDTWSRPRGTSGAKSQHRCKVEYDVEYCNNNSPAGEGCIDVMRTSLVMPFGGYMIYGVAHQHAGASGSALYREDGEVLCESLPTYGKGHEPGNETGYVVGMSTCYPEPGTVKITKGDTLVLESNYSSIHRHAGVMGLFLILVADQLPQTGNPWHHALLRLHDSQTSLVPTCTLIAVLVVVAVVVVGLYFRRRWSKNEDGYQPIST